METATTNLTSQNAHISETHFRRDSDAEDLFRIKGISWEYRPNVPIGVFNAKDNIKFQTRLDTTIHEDTVYRMEIARELGRKLPAVSAIEKEGDFLIIDGRHRFDLSVKLDDTFIDVYLLSSPSDILLEEYSHEINNKGRDLSYWERVTFALHDKNRRGTSTAIAAKRQGLSEDALVKEEKRERATGEFGKYGHLVEVEGEGSKTRYTVTNGDDNSKFRITNGNMDWIGELSNENTKLAKEAIELCLNYSPQEEARGSIKRAYQSARTEEEKINNFRDEVEKLKQTSNLDENEVIAYFGSKGRKQSKKTSLPNPNAKLESAYRSMLKMAREYRESMGHINGFFVGEKSINLEETINLLNGIKELHSVPVKSFVKKHTIDGSLEYYLGD